ncbi:MAG: hypothetical protein KGH75_06215 [Rhodospirillales bacterium]|nr:hypothetical protein [Rhodospirillales bacterium]
MELMRGAVILAVFLSSCAFVRGMSVGRRDEVLARVVKDAQDVNSCYPSAAYRHVESGFVVCFGPPGEAK